MNSESINFIFDNIFDVREKAKFFKSTLEDDFIPKIHALNSGRAFKMIEMHRMFMIQCHNSLDEPHK